MRRSRNFPLLSNASPAAVTGAAASAGTGGGASRNDHLHDLGTLTGAVNLGSQTLSAAGIVSWSDAGAPGSSGDLRRTGNALQYHDNTGPRELVSVVQHLHSASGSSTTTSAHDLATYAVSGLGVEDMLWVVTELHQSGQDGVNGVWGLRNNTDSTAIATLKNAVISSGSYLHNTVNIGQSFQTDLFVGISTGAVDTAGYVLGFSSFSNSATFAGSWTLAWNSPGQVSGGTSIWRWKIYRFRQKPGS